MAFEDVQSSEPTADEMFDSVVESANAPSSEPEKAATTTEPEYEYSALGANRKEPLSLILKRASMGYDYAQKMESYKQQQAEVERTRQEADARHSKFAHLDEYAKQNPEWYNHWSQAYENRQTGMNQQEQPPAVDLSPIKSEIDALKNDFMGVKEFVTKQQQSVEDSKYWDEIKAVQKDFPDVDLNLADDTGKTLEYKILEHAKENGIGSFRIAFRDFYHDKLRSRMYEQAKQDLLKADKENRRKGIVGVSNTPMLNSNMPDLRKMTESQITELAIAEFEGME